MALKLLHMLTAGLISISLLCYAYYYVGVDSMPHGSPALTAAALAVVSDPNFNSTSTSSNCADPPVTTKIKNETVANTTSTKVTVVKSIPTKPQSSTPNNTVPIDSSILMTSKIYVSGHARPHPELCPSLGDSLKIMIFIMSAPSHTEARNAIRLTWGHYGFRKDISMAFFLGLTNDPKIQKSVESEDTLYGDIIRGNFMDSYSNLTLKTISMLEWVDNYCPNVNRVLKTDDDMFINVPQLLKFVDKRAKDNRTIYGKVAKKNPPKRTTKSKYYVSPKQYAQKYFPDFTTGPCYLMTTDCVTGLYRQALTRPYVRLEDVYITGIIAQQLGITRIHAAEFYNKKVALHPCNVQRGISIHMVRFSEQFDLWKKLLDGKSKCVKT